MGDKNLHCTLLLDVLYVMISFILFSFLLDESALLMQLPHGSIARMMGLCVQHGNTKERLGKS